MPESNVDFHKEPPQTDPNPQDEQLKVCIV